MKHLLYHVFPLRETADVPGGWRWNLAQLRRRLNLFDGRKVVAVATGAGTDSFADVQAELAGHDCTFLEVVNDRSLRETVSFDALCDAICDCAKPGHVALYAHAKGVTSNRWASGVVRWAEWLYEACLDYWPVAERLLTTHAVVGPLLSDGPAWDASVSRSTWHFSGSFRWMRLDTLFAWPWVPCERFWAGVEAHPSLAFCRDGATCLGPPADWSGVGLYDASYWDGPAGAALAAWKRGHAGERT